MFSLTGLCSEKPCALQKASGLQHKLKASQIVLKSIILVCTKPYCTLAERWKNISTPNLLLPRSTDWTHKTSVTTNIHVSLYIESSTPHILLLEGKATLMAQEPSHPAAVGFCLVLTWILSLLGHLKVWVIIRNFTSLSTDLPMVLKKHLSTKKWHRRLGSTCFKYTIKRLQI